MSVSHLTCPHCQGSLKSNKPPPVGVDVLCPKCKTFFKVTTGVGAVSGNGVQPRSLTPPAPRPATPTAPTSAGPAPVVSSPTPAKSGIGPGVMLGVALVVIVGGLVAVWLVMGSGGGDSNKPISTDSAKNPEVPEPHITINWADPRVKANSGPQKIEGLTDDENAAVKKMQERGIEFLRKTQNADGTWPHNLLPGHYGSYSHELAAFCGLTMLECGVSAKDPQILRAAEAVRREAPKMNKTYGIAIYIMFLKKLGDTRDIPLIQRLAMTLVNGQMPNGNWDYHDPILSDAQATELNGWLAEVGDMSWQQFKKDNPKRAAALPPHLQRVASFATDPKGPADAFKARGGDHSNTQFALLALWLVRKECHAKLPLTLVVKRFETMQTPDGSWSYAREGWERPVPAMTCAGVLALTLGYALDLPNPAKVPLQDPRIQRGLRYVGNAIPGIPNQPKAIPERLPIYTLWSIERIGVLFPLRHIEGKDWYRWGMRVLMGDQKEDGSWVYPPSDGGVFGAYADTCFALLFLHRVNLVQDLTDKLNDMTGPPPSQPPMMRKD